MAAVAIDVSVAAYRVVPRAESPSTGSPAGNF